MMKEAGHFDQLKKLRISDKDLVPFTAAYDVRAIVQSVETTIFAHISLASACTFPAERVLSAPPVVLLSECIVWSPHADTMSSFPLLTPPEVLPLVLVEGSADGVL